MPLSLKSYKVINSSRGTENPADVGASAGLLRLYRFNEAHDHREQVANVWPHSCYQFPHDVGTAAADKSGGEGMLSHTLTKDKIKGVFWNKAKKENDALPPFLSHRRILNFGELFGELFGEINSE